LRRKVQLSGVSEDLTNFLERLFPEALRYIYFFKNFSCGGFLILLLGSSCFLFFFIRGIVQNEFSLCHQSLIRFKAWLW
ncbi:MAG: hypothetical protein ACXVB4_17765, partial [Pseudobdellovibrionaceae bacterium]